MAIKDSYELRKLNIVKGYSFISVGEKGRILKAIIYEKSRGNRYNLAFGDIVNGVLNDSIISNNNDILKVISTVAKTIYEFTREHPEAIIEIVGVDKKRTNFYNKVFQRRFSEIKETFEVEGIVNRRRESYNPLRIYDSFEVKRKK